MGYLGYFYVENKSFEFRSNVHGGFPLAEKSRGRLREVIMAWPTIFWLKLKLHYEKNREGVSSGDATEGKKQAGPTSGMKKETLPMGVKQDRQSYTEAVVNEKVMVNEFGIQAAGTEGKKLKEWASRGEIGAGPVLPKQRPKRVGRTDQPKTEAQLENRRSRTSEQSRVTFGTKVVDKDGGHSQKPHDEVFVVLAATTGGKGVMDGAGQVKNATYMDGEGRVDHIEALEGMGQLASQGSLNPNLVGETAEDSHMTFKEARGSKTAGEVGLVVKKPTEQYEVRGTVGHDGHVAEMNEEGRAYSNDEGVEEMGEEREKE
ncbi:hypothetical protein FH972_018132 [Carpinus fangiana]|uniref:Uncharacterized protein n=1 Tax=Carpinus fangiana TaxID=176857 RepID=A0A5N6RP22_9ROSI|nr:hypothetical protein FH972_018132 [Carpinus fangiana]